MVLLSPSALSVELLPVKLLLLVFIFRIVSYLSPLLWFISDTETFRWFVSVLWTALDRYI